MESLTIATVTWLLSLCLQLHSVHLFSHLLLSVAHANPVFLSRCAPIAWAIANFGKKNKWTNKNCQNSIGTIGLLFGHIPWIGKLLCIIEFLLCNFIWCLSLYVQINIFSDKCVEMNLKLDAIESKKWYCHLALLLVPCHLVALQITILRCNDGVTSSDKIADYQYCFFRSRMCCVQLWLYIRYDFAVADLMHSDLKNISILYVVKITVTWCWNETLKIIYLINWPRVTRILINIPIIIS